MSKYTGPVLLEAKWDNANWLTYLVPDDEKAFASITGEIPDKILMEGNWEEGRLLHRESTDIHKLVISPAFPGELINCYVRKTNGAWYAKPEARSKR